jgi:hypothetical protein
MGNTIAGGWRLSLQGTLIPSYTGGGECRMKRNRFPAGWDEARVQSVLEHYEQQTEDEALAEDEAAFRLRGQTVVVLPNSLVPEVTRLIGARRSRRQSSSGRPNTVSKPMEH